MVYQHKYNSYFVLSVKMWNRTSQHWKIFHQGCEPAEFQEREDIQPRKQQGSKEDRLRRSHFNILHGCIELFSCTQSRAAIALEAGRTPLRGSARLRALGAFVGSVALPSLWCV